MNRAREIKTTDLLMGLFCATIAVLAGVNGDWIGVAINALAAILCVAI